MANLLKVRSGPVGRTLSPEVINAAAAALEQAERTRKQIGLLSEDHPSITMDDAYAIQAEWVRLKKESGDPVIGWKIGLTSKAMQSALQIDIPDSGVLLKSMEFPNGSAVPNGRFIQPRIEAEIAFCMKQDIGADATLEEILSATEYVAPAIEILDTRIVRKCSHSGRMRTVFDTISDNAANGGVVLGNAVRNLETVDLRRIGAIVSRNGEVEETGLGAGVLGDPLLSMSWLAQRLGAYGEKIEKGQIVLSGSFIRPVECPNASHISCDFGDFGHVEITFE